MMTSGPREKAIAEGKGAKETADAKVNVKVDEQDPMQEACDNEKDASRSNRH